MKIIPQGFGGAKNSILIKSQSKNQRQGRIQHSTYFECCCSSKNVFPGCFVDRELVVDYLDGRKQTRVAGNAAGAWQSTWKFGKNSTFNGDFLKTQNIAKHSAIWSPK